MQLEKEADDFDSSQPLTLSVIHEYLVFLIKSHSHTLYERDTLDTHIGNKLFEDPYMELFLWSVLCKKTDLLDFTWRRCDRPILVAEAGAAIFTKLAEIYKPMLQDEPLQILAERYTNLTNTLMQTAHNVDERMMSSLLDNPTPRMGGLTLLQIAFTTDLMTIIASRFNDLLVDFNQGRFFIYIISDGQCQQVTRINWKRGFERIGMSTCLLCIMFPLLILTPLVRFKVMSQYGNAN